MLLNLHVKNFAIIDEIEVYFQDNLNILSGETGAGKSIIIGSVNVALGGKITKDIIRKGAEYALVELSFQTESEVVRQKMESYDLPIDEDGLILITRKIMSNRSISKINGETVTTNVLKDIASSLIDIHGQHEHQSLLYKNKHLEFVDKFAKNEVTQLKEELEERFHSYSKVKEALVNAKIDDDKRIREMSHLEFEIKEITEAKLIAGEDEELALEFKKLSNANLIAEGLDHTYKMTGYQGNAAGDILGRAVKQLNRVEEYDNQLVGLRDQLLDIEGLLNDFNRELSEYLSNLNTDQEYFEQVEHRLDLVNRLKSKYGNDIPSILAYCKQCEERLHQFQNYDEYLEGLEKSLKVEEAAVLDLSERLSTVRKKNAKILVNRMIQALKDLNFLDVQFDISFTRLDHYTANGFDETCFMISTNPGEDIRPLSDVASGGELSRIMLGLKSVLADNDAIETLIFDEIDVGISGRTAQKVSEKLTVIANKHQVLCITHLPQIAAMADSHYIIEKVTDQMKTTTHIKRLTEQESVLEVARILGGAVITDTVIESAKEMKELAKNFKKL